MKKPAGLAPFVRVQETQSISVLNGRDHIELVPRSRLERKWQVSGGMEDIPVHLWKSDVYKYVPDGYQVWIGNIDVWNGTNFQKNRGWIKSYPSGTEFHDVLTNRLTGEVFEHRIRQKNNGKWKSFVAYSNPAQHPKGYTGITVSCGSCHNAIDGPGTGGYATGLVPGSDTIFSDPF